MTKSASYWTSPKGGAWAVKKEGATRATSVHTTQEAAWSEARRLARGSESEAILQSKDGTIRARNSYGRDPFPPKG